ncbi:MAG: hypothetical protein QW487_04020 [Candidatus Bathyarchaeia archaeon]
MKNYKVFNIKFFVFTFLIVASSLFDAYYTITLIGKYGVFGEKNPIVLFLFNLGLGSIWVIANIVLGFVVVFMFFLFISYLRNMIKYLMINFFALLFTIKMLISIHYLFLHFSVSFSLTNLGVLIFILTVLVLIPKQSIINFLKKNLNILNDLTLIFTSPKFKIEFKLERPVKCERMNKLKDKRLWISLITVILCPFITLVLLQLFWKLSKIQEMPKWLKGLGIVTKVQGILYIASFILIIFMLTIMIYSLMTIFEVFTQYKKIDIINKTT